MCDEVAAPSLVELAEDIEHAGNEFVAMEDEIERLQAMLGPGAQVQDVRARVKAGNTSVERAQKRINHANQQFSKELDAQLPDQAWAATIQPAGAAAHEALLAMVCRHLEQRGLATAAARMLDEDALLPRIDLEPATKLESLLKCLEPGSETSSEAGLDELLAWLYEDGTERAECSSTLPQHLLEIRFFRILVNSGDFAALTFLREQHSRGTTSPLHKQELDRIFERLAGSMALYGTSAWSATQNYIADLHRRASAELISLFWWLRTKSFRREPLLVTLDASVVAYPALGRASKALAMTPWSSENELPVEVALPPSLCFHPIFVCPVLKEQTGVTPPKLLPCGHMLSAAAFAKYSTSQAHVYIKCPYCPKPFGLQDVHDVRFIRHR